MITYRKIVKKDLEGIAEIDRSEDLDYEYVFKDGMILLGSEMSVYPNWNEEQIKEIRRRIENILTEDGIVYGAYDENILVGLVSLSKKMVSHNRVQLATLHVDKKHRGIGIGGMLFDLIVSDAKTLGVTGMYISASRRKSTVDFYLHKGCVLAKNIDEALFKDEPMDIHMEYLFS